MQQTATNISSGKKNQLFISLVVGHETEMLDQPTSEGYTHRWKVFVKTPGPNQLTDRSFIKKVGFRLHPDFKNPERIVRKPPFEVSEQGYGGFTIPVTVVFAEDTLKPFSFNYDLSLEMKPFSIHRRVQLLAVNEKVSPTFMEMIPKYCTGEKKKKKNKRDKEPHNETPTTSSRHNGADEKEKKKMENMPSEDSYPASPMSALFSEQKPKSRKSPEGLGSSPAPPKRSAEEKMKKIKRPKHTSSSSKATPEEPSRTPEKKNVRVLEHDLFSTALQNSAIQKMGEPRKRKNEAVDQLFFEKKTSSSNISKDTSNFQQRHTTAKRAPTHSQIAHMKNRHPGKKTPEPPKRDTNSPLSAKTSARLTESPTCSTPVSSNLSDDPQSNLSSPSTPSTSAASPGNYHSAFEIASPTLSSHEEELPSIDAESLSGQISSLSDPAVILRLAECLISSDCSHLVQISNNLLQCDLRELPFSLLSSISHILHSR